jgi:hypothetical protein
MRSGVGAERQGADVCVMVAIAIVINAMMRLTMFGLRSVDGHHEREVGSSEAAMADRSRREVRWLRE